MKVAKVGGYQRLFRMLNRNRVDVVASPGVNGWFHIKRLKLHGIQEIKPPIMRFDLFNYLHKKNAEIVPLISKVFQMMKKSGELAKLRSHVVSVLLRRAGTGLEVCDDDYLCFDENGK